jgi:Protein kinase domain
MRFARILVYWNRYEYFKGGSLKDRLKTGDLSYNDTVILIKDMTQALEELKVLGILHKNIDMNVIYLGRSSFKLGGYDFCDFGLQSRLSEKGYKYFTNLTKSVMSLNPEITLNRVCNNKTPLFGLGIVLYWLYHKEYPFKVSSINELAIKYQSNDVWVPSNLTTIPKPIENLICGLLQINYMDRLSPSELNFIVKRLFNEIFQTEMEILRARDKLFHIAVREKEKPIREKRNILDKFLSEKSPKNAKWSLPPIRPNHQIVSCMASLTGSPRAKGPAEPKKPEKLVKMNSRTLLQKQESNFQRIITSDFDLRFISPRKSLGSLQKKGPMSSGMSNPSIKSIQLYEGKMDGIFSSENLI